MKEGFFWKDTLSTLFRFLVVSGVLLVSTYLVFQVIRVQNPFFENRWVFQLFDVGLEANAPTFFSVVLFLVLSASAWLCGVFDRYTKKTKKDWIPWMLVSLLLFFFALDELAQVHEQLTYHVQNLFGTSGFFTFAWVIPYGIIVILLSMYLIPFFLKLPRHTRNAILLGGGLFILGAIGVEMIGARFYAIGGVYHPGFIISSSIEEIMEIAGQLIAVFGLFGEVSRRLDTKE